MKAIKSNEDSDKVKGNRRRWLIAALIAFVAIVAGACVIGPPVRWAFTAQPQPSIDGRAGLIALTAQGQPEGENAWPLWLEAFAVLKEVEEEIRARGYASRNEFDDPPSFWQMALFSDFDFEDMEPEAEAIELLRERGFFELTARAAAAPRAVFDGYPTRPVGQWEAANFIGDDWTGYLTSVRRISEVELALMRLEVRENDWQAFLDCLDRQLVIVKHISMQPLSIDYLIAPSVRGRIDEHLNYFLNERAFPEWVLAEIAVRLNVQTPAEQQALFLEGEKIALLEFIDHIYESDDAGGRFIPTALNAWQRTRAELAQTSRDWLRSSGVHTDDVTMPSKVSRLSNVGGLRRPNRSDVEAFIEDSFRRLSSWATQRSSIRAAQPFDGKALDQELVNHFGWSNGPFEQLKRLVGMPDSYTVHCDATRLRVAIERYRLVHTGALPAELRDLVPQFLDKVPIDPVNGEEFIYRQTDDEFGFMLYSMGLDGEDNGGEEGDGFALIDLENGRGFDVVFGRRLRPSSDPEADARNEMDH